MSTCAQKSNLLAYYQKHAKEAFQQGFTTRMYYEIIDPEVYEVQKYYLPAHASKRVKWVRNYFKSLDDQEIDIVYRRRKNWVEYAETAMLILTRIHYMIQRGNPIAAGSPRICAVPWVIFGDGPDRLSQEGRFSTIGELATNYQNFLYGNCYPIDIHFRVGAEWPHKIAANYNKRPGNSPNFWMAVALCLTYDIIHKCGPDCPEFFELFTNDFRENTENIDLDAWERLRCRILGIAERPNLNKLPKSDRNNFVGPLELPRKPIKVKTEITLISENYDLMEGEKTISVLPKKEKSEDTKPLPEYVQWSSIQNDIEYCVGPRRHQVPQRFSLIPGTPDMI